MRVPGTLALAAGLLAASTQAWGWGAAGHMAVGTIADHLVAGSPAAKEVRKILGSNLRTAAVWADCAKGVNTATFKYGGRGRFQECEVYENPASEKQLEAFVRRNVGNCTSEHNTEPCHQQYHYTDVAIQRAKYEKGFVGTSEQDVVAAINACIVVLQGGDSPAPFRIQGKREALRLLAHYVGDLHQPLHVAAVYVDAQGNVIDPDEGSFDPKTQTRGGNDLLIKVRRRPGEDKAPPPKKLHGLWDNVAGSVTAEQPTQAVLNQALEVPATGGPIRGWAALWATESLARGQEVFAGITYTEEDKKKKTHFITLPAGYDADVRKPMQREQVIKAGARLAHIVMAIFN